MKQVPLNKQQVMWREKLQRSVEHHTMDMPHTLERHMHVVLWNPILSFGLRERDLIFGRMNADMRDRRR